MKRNDKLDYYFRTENWKKARESIYFELLRKPQDHWLMTRLSMTYYEEYDYKNSLKISTEAFKIAPNCPLVLWDYAAALQMNKMGKDALIIWKKIITKGEYKIANDECGEGLKWARSLINDCRFRIGMYYVHEKKIKLGYRYLLQHLKVRKLRMGSIYNLKMIKKQILKLESEINCCK
jgi:tetratricopeptide (TPR) repeat protein